MDDDNTRDYYNWEMNKFGRVRKNLNQIINSPNVVDFEPYILGRLAMLNQLRQFGLTYNWYLRNGYDFKKDPYARRQR